MVLVVGATGLVGLNVCERLRERGDPVRALVRTTSAPEKKDPPRTELQYAAGDPIDMRPVLELLPLKLTSVSDYAAKLRKS